MLNQIIKNVALILDDKIVLENLIELSNNPEAQINEETSTYITLTNFVISNIAENYLCYKCTDEVVSDKDCKISLGDLKYGICSIKCVKNENLKKVVYSTSIDYIFVNEANKLYYVEYAFFPPSLTNIDDTVMLPLGLDYKAICYGVISEYYTLKMQYAEANVWEQKFKNSLKNLSLNSKFLKLAFRGW